MANTYVNKVQLADGTVLLDVSSDTVAADKVLYGYTAHRADGASITGSIATKTSSDMEVNGGTVTAPAGYYASEQSKSVATGTEGTPTATKGTVSSNSVSVTPSVTNSAGYISGSTKTGTAVTVSASELVSGTKSITSSGSTDVTNYKYASVSAGSITNNTSGGTSSGTVNRGSQIKIGAGYYASDAYYTAQANSGTKDITTFGTVSCDGYSNVSIPEVAFSINVSATSNTSATINDNRITANTYVYNTAKTDLNGDVSWTTSAGSITLSCSSGIAAMTLYLCRIS